MLSSRSSRLDGWARTGGIRGERFRAGEGKVHRARSRADTNLLKMGDVTGSSESLDSATFASAIQACSEHGLLQILASVSSYSEC